MAFVVRATTHGKTAGFTIPTHGNDYTAQMSIDDDGTLRSARYLATLSYGPASAEARVQTCEHKERSLWALLFRARDCECAGAQIDAECPPSADADIGRGRDGPPVVGAFARCNARYPGTLAFGQGFEFGPQLRFLLHLFQRLKMGASFALISYQIQ